MSSREQTKAELKEVLQLGKTLAATLREKSEPITFGATYQRWYTRALPIVKALAPALSR